MVGEGPAEVAVAPTTVERLNMISGSPLAELLLPSAKARTQMCCPVGPLSVQRCCGGLTDPVQELPHVRQPEWGRLVHQAACGSIALAEQVSVPEVDAFSGTLPMDNHSPKSQCFGTEDALAY